MVARSKLAAVAVLVLGGCADLSGESAPASRLAGAAAKHAPNDGLTCAEASYGATLRDAAAARTIVETALRAQVADARGDMVTAGFRQLRAEYRPTQCAPTGMLTHEVHCKATASVCGR
jgi:hypothetical protein